MKSRRDKGFRSAPKQGPPVGAALERAIAHHQAGRLAEAEAGYREALASKPEDAVALHYLGVIAYQVGQHAVALELIDAALRANPEYAEAYSNRGITLHAMRRYEDAVASYDEALRLDAKAADAYSNRGNSLYELKKFEEAAASCERAIALRPEYAEAHNNLANALHALEHHEAAVASYDRAIALRPEYAEAHSNRGNALQSLAFARAGREGSSGRDLVFYCGRSTEVWNPETARTKGIGGSEEAVVWLSRLLYRRGWNVTVYAECGEERVYDGVRWRPYWEWNYRDRQDVTVLWRYPEFADYEINSAKVVLDLHDVFFEADFPIERLARIDRIFVKSRFHRSLFPGIAEEKFAVVPNGIDVSLFEGAMERDAMLLINTSSADRSLEAFLDCFAEIKRKVPEAKAEWAYGWGVWDSVRGQHFAMMQWKARMQERMRELGVVERGRIGHDEVAQLYLRANVFGYPSEMAEIDCISLSKAMAAGAIPITTDFAALGEKEHAPGIFLSSAKTKDDWSLPGQFHFEMTGAEQKAAFVREAVRLLREPPGEDERAGMREWARGRFDWNAVADAWSAALEGSQQETALDGYERALALNPKLAEAHNSRGAALMGLLRHEEALASFERAIDLKAEYAEAHANRATALMMMKRYKGALASFEEAVRLKPDFEYLPGMVEYLKRFLCEWEGSEGASAVLEAAVMRGERAALPFAMLAISSSAEVQKKAAEIYVRDKYPDRRASFSVRPRGEKVRVGYFSADFYDHATSYLMAELFELHDRKRFEIVGFSFGPDVQDAMRARVASGMDRFVDVRGMSDPEIAELSRRLEVDIAVDLKGFTRDHRAGIFAAGAAPIQASWVGYPGTMGAEYIDYLIADGVLIPEERRKDYTEKILYLPDSYQPNDSRRAVSGRATTRAEEGLPEGAFVFCCFNNAYKIGPAVFDVWMRILRRVEGSVLWLLEENGDAAANLRREAARRGVDAGRIVFARPVHLADHLARHGLADLFLDTAPYGAHTTASDALWMGLPVVTCTGPTFASRVAASLLHAVGLRELVTETAADFEELAVALAADTERLGSLRRRLVEGRGSAALFNTGVFARQLEAGYAAMMERYWAGLEPEHIQVARIS